MIEDFIFYFKKVWRVLFYYCMVNKGIRIFRKGEKFNEFVYCYKGYVRLIVVFNKWLKWVWNFIDLIFNYNNISLNLFWN